MAIVGLKNQAIKIKINDEVIDGTTNENGIFTGTKTLSTPGAYVCNAIYDGDGKYNGVTSQAVTVTAKYRTKLTLSGNTDVETTDTNTYDVILKHGGSSDETLTALTGKNVKVLLDGVVLIESLAIAEEGHAQFTLGGTTNALTEGTHTIKVQFAEDDENWECESNELTINVAKGDTSLEFTATPTKVIVGDDLTYTATLKGNEVQ